MIGQGSASELHNEGDHLLNSNSQSAIGKPNLCHRVPNRHKSYFFIMKNLSSIVLEEASGLLCNWSAYYYRLKIAVKSIFRNLPYNNPYSNGDYHIKTKYQKLHG